MGDEASLTDIADSEALQVQEPMIEIEVDVHTDDAVFAIAGDMEPCAGVYECWVPALQDV
jgi:hypothetical protein